MKHRLLASALLTACMAFGQTSTWVGSTLVAGSNCLIMNGVPAGTFVCDPAGSIPAKPQKPRLPNFTKAQLLASVHIIPAASIAGPEYMKVAKAISLKSAATDESQMGELLNRHGFKIFDFDKVDTYLYNKALQQKAGTRWVWKPLRTRDHDWLQNTGLTYRQFDGFGYVDNVKYVHAIPEKTLDKIACLIDEMPEALFLVSDYEVIKPDPFLAVTTADMLEAHRLFIIDMWDEPGFGENAPSIVASR